MTSISRNMYIDNLGDILNTYHSTIKMKPVDIKLSTNTDFDEKNNKEGPKLKVGDHVRISKYKNIFAKGLVRNLPEKFFLIKKLKHTVSWTDFISDLMLESFMKKNSKKKSKRV